MSIEEQFYLFIPLLCAILWRWRMRWLVPAFVMLAVSSFVAAVVTVAMGNQNSAFYLLQYRAWELLVGSLLSIVAVAPSNLTSRGGGGRGQASSSAKVPAWFLVTVGLLLVLVPYALLSRNTPFPGAAVLPSILGTAMLIRYGQTGWVNRFLCWRPFIALGKISYSLYLWHWPIIVFWRYVTYDQLVVWDYVGMFILSLLLAYLSWRVVEMPVRMSPTWTMRKSFTFAAVGIVLFATLGLTCALQRGWPGMIHPQADAIAAKNNVRKVLVFHRSHWLSFMVAGTELDRLMYIYGDDGMFRLGEAKAVPEVFLLGDSHAAVLRYGLSVILQQRNLAGLSVTYGGTDMTDMSTPKSQEAMRELRSHPSISKVILAQRWRNYEKNSSQEERLKKFSQCIKAMGKMLYVLTDVPQMSGKVREEMMPRVAMFTPRRMGEGWDGYYSQEYYDQQQGEINQHLQFVCDETGAKLIPLHLAFKQADGRYKAFETRDGRHIALYRDGDHLSSDGSLKAGQFLAPYIFEDASRDDKKR